MTKHSLIVLVAMLVLCVAAFGQTGGATNDVVLDQPKKPAKPPETPDEFYEAARWASWNDRNYTEAYRLLDQAIQLDPMHLDAYRLRGIYRFQNDDCKKAIPDFDFVLVNEPGAVDVYQFRGGCKVILKDYRGALADMDASVAKLAERNQIQHAAFVKRGKVHYILGNYDLAIADFTAAAKMNISSSPIVFRALTYFRKGDVDNALADMTSHLDYYQKITESARSKYPEQYQERSGYPPGEDPLGSLKPKPKKGLISRFELSGGSASASCEGCVKRTFAEFIDKIIPDNWFFPGEKTFFDPDYGEVDFVYYLMGTIQVGRGELNEAHRSFTNAIIAAPIGNSLIYFQRGKINLKLGNFEPAVRDFSWAISQQTRPIDAFLERGIAIMMLGHDELAQKDIDKYLQLIPDAKPLVDERVATAKAARKKLADEGTVK